MSTDFTDASEDMKLTVGLGQHRVDHVPSGLALLSNGTTGSITQVRSDGYVTNLKPRLPEHLALDSILSSPDKLLLRVSNSDLKSDAKYKVFQLEDNGEVEKEIDLAPVPAAGVACEKDGRFVLLHWVDKQPFIEEGKFK